MSSFHFYHWNQCTLCTRNLPKFCATFIGHPLTARHNADGLSGCGLMTSSGHAHRSFNKTTRNWLIELHVTPVWWYTAANWKFLQALSSSWNGWPFGHNRHGPKSAGAMLLVRKSWIPIYHNVAWAKAYLCIKCHLIHSAIWPQQTLAKNWGAVPRCEEGSWVRQGRGLPPYQVISWSI